VTTSDTPAGAISGGENISSVEVEAALTSHPQVLETAVAGGGPES
jgi:acyl-CoA synthetase (AMP-forming)/AMP-acid ligase II